MRKYEKISYSQFEKDVSESKELYESYPFPKRSTKYSAGYDFESLFDFTLKPNETIKIPLGFKVLMEQDEYLMLVVRSSMGFKYNIRLTNQVGIIDHDYYNNINNEGHMFINIQNHGNKDFVAKKGDKICQGIFHKYLLVDDEEEIEEERTGWSVLKED